MNPPTASAQWKSLDKPAPNSLPESCKLLHEIWLIACSRAVAHKIEQRIAASAEANFIADLAESMLTKEILAAKKAATLPIIDPKKRVG